MAALTFLDTGFLAEAGLDVDLTAAFLAAALTLVSFVAEAGFGQALSIKILSQSQMASLPS